MLVSNLIVLDDLQVVLDVNLKVVKFFVMLNSCNCYVILFWIQNVKKLEMWVCKIVEFIDMLKWGEIFYLQSVGF